MTSPRAEFQVRWCPRFSPGACMSEPVERPPNVCGGGGGAMNANGGNRSCTPARQVRFVRQAEGQRARNLRKTDGSYLALRSPMLLCSSSKSDLSAVVWEDDAASSNNSFTCLSTVTLLFFLDSADC